MSKATKCNLTRVQYEFLSDMIPEPKPGGRPREVDLWEVLNAIFASPGGRSAMASITRRLSTVADGIHAIGNWRQDGTWIKIHDSLRSWDENRAGTTSESITSNH